MQLNSIKKTSVSEFNVINISKKFILFAAILNQLSIENYAHFCGLSHPKNDNLVRIRRANLKQSIQKDSVANGKDFAQQLHETLIDEPKQNDTLKLENETGQKNCHKPESRFANTPNEQAKQRESDTRSIKMKTIETAVFIDQALDSKFISLSGGLVELNKLVLTIMNQVQYLFKYNSMQIPIRVKLVLIEQLKESEKRGIPSPNSERGDIDAYLSNFCNWQQARLEREKKVWWDHAILLSGLDLYKATPGKNHTGVLGLAWVGGMCKGNYSCTINEASNLESAFVIAHEIGHSLGIMHDGQRNNCDPNGFIMSERTGAGKIHWSRCSNHYLNESINRHQLTCLDVERSPLGDSMYDLSKLKVPGQVYGINEQCKLAFGSNYSSFVTRQQPFNVSAVCLHWTAICFQ